MLLENRNDIKQRRAINFDLSIEKLMAFYSKTNPKGAYKDIYNYFIQNGFEHRQGSGYCSRAKLTNGETLDIVNRMFKEMPWLDECSKKIDVTNIGEIYDIKDLRAMGKQHEHLQEKSQVHKNKPSVLKRLEENKKILAEKDVSEQNIVHHRENER